MQGKTRHQANGMGKTLLSKEKNPSLREEKSLAPFQSTETVDQYCRRRILDSQLDWRTLSRLNARGRPRSVRPDSRAVWESPGAVSTITFAYQPVADPLKNLSANWSVVTEVNPGGELFFDNH